LKAAEKSLKPPSTKARSRTPHITAEVIAEVWRAKAMELVGGGRGVGVGGMALGVRSSTQVEQPRRTHRGPRAPPMGGEAPPPRPRLVDSLGIYGLCAVLYVLRLLGFGALWLCALHCSALRSLGAPCSVPAWAWAWASWAGPWAAGR
jgi:hypothetical protein